MPSFVLTRGRYERSYHKLVQNVLLTVILNPPPAPGWKSVQLQDGAWEQAYCKRMSMHQRCVFLLLCRGRSQEELRVDLPLCTVYYQRALAH